MRTHFMLLMLALPACHGVDGSVIGRGSTSGDGGGFATVFGAPPPREELVWWRTVGSPGSDGGNAVTSTANASVLVGTAEEAIETFTLSFMSGAFVHGVFDRGEIGIAENGEVNAGSFSRTNSTYGQGESPLTDVATASDDTLWIAGGLTGRTDFGGADVDIGDAHAAYVVRYPVQLNGDALARTFVAMEARTTALATAATTVYAAITYAGSLATGLSDVLAEGPEDGALLALDLEGNTLWAQRIGGPGRDQALAVAALADGAVVVGTSESGLRPGGPAGGFVRRFDASGVVLWETILADAAVESVAAHLDGSVTVAGTRSGEGFVAHLAPDGTLEWTSTLWLRTAGQPVVVTIDSVDRITVGGQTQGPPGEDTPGAFLELYDRAGTSTRSRIYPGIAILRDIVPAGDDLLVVGTFESIDLGSGWLSHAGATDSFIARLRVSVD